MTRKLPQFCGARHPDTNAPVMIYRSEDGFREWSKASPLSPEQFNKMHRISDATVALMIDGAMTGHWEQTRPTGGKS